MSKVYMIVTNDEYETPVKCDIIGAKAVSEYMGISLIYLRRMLCGSMPWSKKQKYKAIIMGEANLKIKNKNLYDMTHDRSEYFRRRYLEKKQKKRQIDNVL